FAMLAVITNASVKLVNRYLPSSFVFSIILTLIAFAAGLILTGQDILAMAGHWGNGLWSLHGFAMQMALILITGYALANAPFIQRFLDAMASRIHSPKAAIIIVTLVAMAGALINWGFGLVISAVFARSLAKKV
ncbi:TIGR00366 family protein, partial [uncultured Psychrobacter sp.]|uniref:TIGR00366 family protein n=1 Tax=uncultured Psychrobacter sp. TaxID=259303 RepID=UPI003457D29C